MKFCITILSAALVACVHLACEAWQHVADEETERVIILADARKPAAILFYGGEMERDDSCEDREPCGSSEPEPPLPLREPETQPQRGRVTF